jgi:hypothetical protein
LENLASTFLSPLSSFAVFVLPGAFISSRTMSLVVVTGRLFSSTNIALTVTTHFFTSIVGRATKNLFFFASTFRMKVASTMSGPLSPVNVYPKKRGSISYFWYSANVGSRKHKDGEAAERGQEGAR